MGRVLFVRVSVETYDEKDVTNAWPKLFAAAWPDPAVDGSASPAKLARKLIPAPDRGALELVAAFIDYARFGGGQKDMQAHADTLEKLKMSLDDALGNRDVAKASSLIDAIESALDAAENDLR